MHKLLTLTLFSFLLIPLTVPAQQPWRLTDKEADALFDRLGNRTDKFHDALSKGLKKTSLDKGRGDDSALQYAEDLKVSARRLRDRFDGKRSVAADVEEVLRRSLYLDDFMQQHPVVTGADREWAEVRQQLDLLGRAWNVRWHESGPDNRPSRLNDAEVLPLAEGIKRNAEQLRYDTDKALKNNRTIDKQVRKNVSDTLRDLARSADRLKNRIRDSQDAARQVDELLRLGATVDRFFGQYRLGGRVQGDWGIIRNYLNQVARTYNVRW